jgi:hypothetical protein
MRYMSVGVKISNSFFSFFNVTFSYCIAGELECSGKSLHFTVVDLGRLRLRIWDLFRPSTREEQVLNASDCLSGVGRWITRGV